MIAEQRLAMEVVDRIPPQVETHHVASADVQRQVHGLPGINAEARPQVASVLPQTVVYLL
jgi:hypothetical protein